MDSKRIGVRGYLTLAAVVAVELAAARDVLWILQVPALAVMFVALNLALFALAVSCRGLNAGEVGFIATGVALAILTLPYSQNPAILQSFVDLYRLLSGDTRIFRFNSGTAFLHAERAAFTAILLLAALAGGSLASSLRRRRRRRQRADASPPP